MPKLKFPLYLFSSFTLGPDPKKVANNEAELLALLEETIMMSPTGEVLVSISPEPLPEHQEEARHGK